jgi:hypothetical protein
MLTPAEALGLSGLALASRVNKALYTFPDAELAELAGRLRQEALARGLIYMRDGSPEPISIMLRPITVLPDQLVYLRSVSLTILNALKRLPELYLRDPAVRAALRLPADEEAWFHDCWAAVSRESDPVFGRLDAVVDFTSPMWKDSLKFVEPNLTGVGGLHMIPTAEAMIADIVAPALRKVDPLLELEPGNDIRELLMQDVFDHLEAIGRPRNVIAFLEPTHSGSGPDEQEALVRYYHDRYGLRVLHADPAELTRRGDEVYLATEALDVAYRDYEMRDLVALEREGVDVRPVRALFRQNRVVSSVTGDFDQKSCFEVLTDPELTRLYFHPEERQVFRRHILWTRVLSDRRTTLPDGTQGDLLPFIRREREHLVLKPNRSYGGVGVAIGPSLSQADWEQVIELALADPDRWVAQRLASLPVGEFPIVGPDGSVSLEPFHLVMGFAVNRYGISTLARASQKQVVNVAQHGGLCAVMVGRPPARLVGPGPHA